MFRLIGAVLIVGAMGWGGRQAGKAVKRRLFLLRRLIYGLEKIRREVSWSQTPLPKLLSALGKGEDTLLSEFWTGCAGGASMSGVEFRKYWETGLEKLEPLLDGVTREILRSVGQGLGRYDGEGEERLLGHAVSELEAHLALLTEEGMKSAKLYQILGFTAGAFLTLFLI